MMNLIFAAVTLFEKLRRDRADTAPKVRMRNAWGAQTKWRSPKPSRQNRTDHVSAAACGTC
jgi:hypothetical protein